MMLLLSLLSLVAATKYELIAIHSDSNYRYSTINYDPTTKHFVLDGEPMIVELEGGKLYSHTSRGKEHVAVNGGYPELSSQPQREKWHISDSIYLAGSYWVCEDQRNTIVTGDSTPPRDCVGATPVQLFAGELA